MLYISLPLFLIRLDNDTKFDEIESCNFLLSHKYIAKGIKSFNLLKSYLKQNFNCNHHLQRATIHIYNNSCIKFVI